MSNERVSLTIDGAVAVLTLTRPEKLNAIDEAMLAGLEQSVREVEANAQVRVAILTGSGERAFSTGGDIVAWSGLDALEFGRSWVRSGHRVFDELARLRQPLITVLNGHAFGGGLELAATGDIVLIEEHATLGLPETGLGMTPGWSGTQRLVRRFGSRPVKRMALAGATLDAPEAETLGIADRVVAKGRGLAEAKSLAKRMAERGPVAMQITKQLINTAEGEASDAAMESLAGALVSSTWDLKEGVAGFREKRTPLFEDR
ncbi:MAG: enoyl-CoA hydratase/isomerase family protein [Pseudomonadota bacterium]